MLLAFLGTLTAASSANAAVLIDYYSSGHKYLQIRSNTSISSPSGWASRTYNDRRWRTGSSPFANANGCGWTRRTYWAINTDLLVRTRISLPYGGSNLILRVAIDNDIVAIYVNGRIISSLKKYEGCATRPRVSFTVPNSYLVNGTNVIAVRMRDRGGAATYALRVEGTRNPSPPELSMYSFVTPSSSRGAGSTIRAAFRVRNSGATNAGRFYVYFYYGDSTSTSGITYLGRYYFSGGLRAGTISGTLYLNLRLPNNVLYGGRRIHWYVDAQRQVTELYETNNRGSRALSITGLPDLRFNYFVRTPSSVAQGAQMRLSYRVYNYGYSRLPTYADVRFYYGHTSTSTTAVLYTRRIPSLNALTYAWATNGAVQAVTVVIPATAAVGLRYVGGVADYTGRIRESNETNNAVRASFTVLSNRADLRMYTWSTSTSSARGSGSRVTITSRVRNDGSGNAGRFFVSYYYGDSNSTSGLTYIGRYYFSGGLRARTTSGNALTVVTLPANVLYGSRRIHYYIDYTRAVAESNENNNRSYRAISITGRPDLQVSYFYRTPSTQAPGGAVRITTRYYNAGYSRIPTTTYARIYLSNNSALTSGNVYLGRQYAFSSLNARTSTTTYGTSVTIPTTTSQGTKYIGAYIDYNGRVAETNENNNKHSASISIVSSRAELRMFSFSIRNRSVTGAGSRITANFRVRNDGSANTSYFYVGFYYKDNTSTSGMTFIGNYRISSLNRLSTTGNIVQVLTLPNNVLYGTRYIHSYIDYTNRIGEGNENNNRNRISISITGRPNLQVNHIVPNPTSQIPTGRITLQFRVYNAGYSRLPTYQDARLYFSNDSTIRTSDTYLGQYYRVTALNARSQTGIVARVITLPSNAATGRRYLGVYADATGRISETSESDNARAAAITVLSGTPDLYMYSFAPNTRSVPGYTSRVTIRLRVRNRGSGNAGAFYVGLYYGNSTSTSGLTYLNRYRFSSLNRSATSGTVAVVVTLPNSVLFGTRYLHWFVDYTGSVRESSETNNRGYTSLSITSRPNLQISHLSVSPSTQSPGGRITVVYRITNYGFSRVNSYFDTPLYYSHDSSITTSDARLYVRRVSSLNGRATASYSQVLTVPTNAVPGGRYIGAIADYTGRVSESSESDNTRSARFIVGGKPDLRMLSFSVTSSARGFGTRITATWRARNYGPVNAGAFYVSMYYGNSTSTSSLTYLGRVRVSSLARLATTGTYRTALTLPNTVVYGSRNIHYYVDYSRTVSESNENNNRGSAKLSITGKPDLQVSYLVVSPTTQVQGGAIRLSYKVTNYGYSRAATTFYTRFYYSVDSTIRTSDVYLGRQLTLSSLNARSSSPSSGNGVLTASLPTTAKIGAGYVGAYTDYNGRIGELSETNNTRAARITISSAAPDLTVSSFTSTSSTRGAGSKVTVTIKVRNIGATNAGKYEIGFYYGDTSSTSRLTFLGGIAQTSLNKGATTGSLVKVLTLPSNVLYGSRRLHYFIDYKNQVGERNENNNRGYRGLTITGRPNLQVSFFTGKPSSIGPGGRASLLYRVFNEGYSRVPSYFYTRFYYSTDSSITSGDTSIGSQLRLSTLNARSYYPPRGNGGITTNIPGNALAGTRYLGAFVDYNGRIRETNEKDNTRAWKFTVTGRADLVMSSWTASTTATGRSSRIFVSFKIRNNGNANATAFKIGFYYGNSTSTSGLVLMGSYSISSLKAQTTSSSLLLSITLPGSVQYGRRYIHYYIDNGKKVAETNENNNRGYRTLTITGRPNLIVSTISASPSSQSPNGTISVQYRVQNTGFSRVSGSFFLRFYFSKDATISTSDTYLGAEVRINGLIAGSSFPTSTNGTVSVKVPAKALAGTAYIGAYVDYNAQHTETSESDNTKAARINVTGNPDLVAVNLTLSPTTQQTGKIIQVSYRITNNGIKSSGSFVVHVYHSSNTLINLSDTRISSFNITGLRVGQTATGTRAITLPTSLNAGNGFIGIFVDPNNRVSEIKENNNTAVAKITILVDKDKDGFTNDKDCDDNDPQVYPKAKEICDGKDNNCNKKIDEGCSCRTGKKRACFSAGTGCKKGTNGKYTCKTPCKVGEQICKAGKWDACKGEVTPKAEICDGKDNNCDGNIDEALSRKCYTGDKATQNVGVCKDGSQECVSAKWGKCKGEVKPVTESCNGKDDDCDGKIDNIKGKNDSLTQTCYTGPQGTDRKGDCKGGKKTCNQGKWSSCQGEVTPQKELCDNKDNDCDGVIDGKLNRSCYSGPQGTDGTGACKAGNQACKAGKWSTCTGEVKPEKETCDGKDNDCDGKIDEKVTRKCYSGPSGTTLAGQGICKEGTQICKSGAWDTCKGQVLPEKETCDGKDNDCDGKIDNKPKSSDNLEKDCSNACSKGTETCKSGKWQNCTAQVCGEATEEPVSEYPSGDSSNPEFTEFSTDGGADGGTPESSAETKPETKSCYLKGCPSGQICQSDQCVPDPCDGVSCKSGQFCRAGNCIKACGCTKCSSGEKCIDGSCQVDTCANVSCSAGEICDSTTGQCEKDLCSSGVTCGKGRVCERGKCIDDACANITCPTGNECKAGQCVGKTCSNENPGEGEVSREGNHEGEVSRESNSEGEGEVARESNGEGNGEKAAESNGEGNGEKAAEKATEKATEKADEKPVEKTADKAGDAGEMTTEKGNTAEKTVDGGPIAIGGGCGCTVNTDSRGPFILFFSLMILVLPFLRRRKK